jgi:hypothetical protein
MLYEKVIKLTGWDLSIVSKSNFKELASSFRRYISEETFSTNELTSDEIFFSGDQPFIYIKQLSKLDFGKIRQLHSKIWNEGRAPFLATFTPTEMRLFNCYEPPVKENEEVEIKLQIDKFEDITQDLERLVEYLHQSKIDSGKIWEEKYGLKVNVNNRVDRRLVDNLKATRGKLYSEGSGLPLPIIHSLLGRALFIFYLEDRNILFSDQFPKKPRGVNCFSDLLNHREETYELFEKLQEKFNGDLFPVTKREKQLVKNSHLEYVRQCFYNLDVKNGQRSLWRMFQFEFIPIELISAIYEEFMSEEEKQKDGQVKIKKNGAYYTKPMLVEFMLNEVLPWPDINNKRYDLKILDPACGSGIFLVESYRRLIARWKFSKNRKKIDENGLHEILTNSIFGIDLDREAIRVTAFSLYLTFLNYLEPIQIRNDYIEKKRKKLPVLIRWADVGGEATSGKNLYQLNTFSTHEILPKDFDIIIGNPPWKKDKPEGAVATYIRDRRLPAQIVCAYLDYASVLAPNGVIALVSSAKVLFNTGTIYDQFRQKFFTENIVETIVNLSVVRDIMFDNASAPGAVIIYRKKQQEQRDYVVYCVPKNTRIINNKQSLVIDGTEVKYLPLTEILKANSKIFKISMWGGMRDYLFIDWLQKISPIGNLTSKDSQGTGLHSKDSQDHALDKVYANYKLLPMNKVQRYYSPNSQLKTLGDEYLRFREIKSQDIFSPPIILLKRGTSDTRFVCSYVDYKCVFTDRVYGLSLKDKPEVYCKALVATMNSSLASYYLFMISSTWAVDKAGDTLHEEIISFPAITEKMNSKTINLLAEKVDEILDLFMDREVQTKRIEDEIDSIIFKELAIGKNEQFLVRRVLDNSIGLQSRYSASKAEIPTNINNGLKSYISVFSKTLNKTLELGRNGVWVEVLNTNKREPVHVVIIHFNKNNSPDSSVVTEIKNEKYSSLMKEINNNSLEQHSESIYYRKIFKYYKKDKIYLIKPNEKRFWTEGEALYDSDSILADLLNS